MKRIKFLLLCLVLTALASAPPIIAAGQVTIQGA